MKKFWFVASYYLEYLLVPFLFFGYIYQGIMRAFEWIILDIREHRRIYNQKR
jgi:hypothetical protein